MKVKVLKLFVTGFDTRTTLTANYKNFVVIADLADEVKRSVKNREYFYAYLIGSNFVTEDRTIFPISRIQFSFEAVHKDFLASLMEETGLPKPKKVTEDRVFLDSPCELIRKIIYDFVTGELVLRMIP